MSLLQSRVQGSRPRNWVALIDAGPSLCHWLAGQVSGTDLYSSTSASLPLAR